MKQEFTHHAKFYGIPCYWNDEKSDLKAKNWFYSLLLSIAIFIEAEFPSSDEGFPIEILDELEINNRFH